MHKTYPSPPQRSCSACSNEKGVNCLQVRLCWCMLAGAAFASVEKHREICSAVLPLSTMEDGRGWLTGFGAVSGIHSQDPGHSSLCVSLSKRGGSSHSNRPRWATGSVSTRCTVCVNVCISAIFGPYHFYPCKTGDILPELIWWRLRLHSTRWYSNLVT